MLGQKPGEKSELWVVSTEEYSGRKEQHGNEATGLSTLDVSGAELPATPC